MLMCVRVSLCTSVIHNTAQSNFDHLPSYPPDKHQSSDAVYWMGGGTCDGRTVGVKYFGGNSEFLNSAR